MASAGVLGTVVTVATTLASCSKTIEQAGGDPDINSGQREMRFTSDLSPTKAFITKDTIEEEGTILRLADIVTLPSNERVFFFGANAADITGHGVQKGSDLFRKTGGDWVRYRNAGDYGGHYYWTEHGVHKFFGWARGVKLNEGDAGNTAADAMITNYTLRVTDNPSVLEIPSLTLTDDVTPQFDFVYTDVVMRDMDGSSHYPAIKDNKYETVPLNFHHLFSALAITVENQSTQPLYVTDLTLTGLKTTSGATITFNDASASSPHPAVAIPRANTQMTEVKTGDSKNGTTTTTYQKDGFIQSSISSVEVPARVTSNGNTTYSKLDIFSKDAQGVSQVLDGSSDSEARLIWPQNVEKLKLTLSYKTSDAETTSRTKELELDYTNYPDDASASSQGSYSLLAGSKYRINILFKGDNVPLNCSLTALPWDSESETLDIAIKCNPSLSLTYEENGTDVTLESKGLITAIADAANDPLSNKAKAEFPQLNETYIKCTFTPLAPQGGDWMCEIYGGETNFSFTDSPDGAVADPVSMTTDANGEQVYTNPPLTIKQGSISLVNGEAQPVTLYLRPTKVMSSGQAVSCSLRFHIKSANVDADATDQFNPNNYLFTYTRP